MAPPRGKKRKSGAATAADEQNAPTMAEQRIATKSGSPSESPRKKRKVGITLRQKQALIDNLQLEITERARRLRAQYNLQAQGLRTRIEIRVNRIPMALRKARMRDLLDQQASQQNKPRPAAAAVAAAMMARPPPVPEKDYPPTGNMSHKASPAPVPRAGPGRPPKRRSDDMAGGDKENHDESIENPKKRPRAHPAATGTGPDPSKVLSPASSNSRLNPRERAPAVASPNKSLPRPVSPLKPATSSSLLGSMVEKARSTRATATRKATASSTASSSAAGTTASRSRRAAAPAKATATRTTRRVSGISESSEGSTATVVRKTGGRAAAAAKAPPLPPKRTMMNTIKKGVTSATTRKAPAPKATQPAAAATTRSGRVLRKRD